MSKLSSLLQERFKKKEKTKITELAEKTSHGNLTVFSGIFAVRELEDKEKEQLLTLLHRFSEDPEKDVTEDLKNLMSITSEVRAIQTQAVLLHGERIKRAGNILKKYREGAFSAWLLAAYGNRQTPYNFLQYYEFYTEMPKDLHPLIESMPRQAIYSLASREGSFVEKERIIRGYQGETKEELIFKIRAAFPLHEKDGRRENVGDFLIKSLEKLKMPFENRKVSMTPRQKKKINKLIGELLAYVDVSEIDQA